MYKITLNLSRDGGSGPRTGEWYLTKKIKLPFLPRVGDSLDLPSGNDVQIPNITYGTNSRNIVIDCYASLATLCIEIIETGWKIVEYADFLDDDEAQAELKRWAKK